MHIANETRVFLALGATDMRKSINKLSLLVAEKFEKDVFSGQIFVFCSQNKKIIKVLYWEKNGFCLWCKRLEKGKFLWPNSHAEILQLNFTELRWLLDGLNPLETKGHKDLNYSEIY